MRGRRPARFQSIQEGNDPVRVWRILPGQSATIITGPECQRAIIQNSSDEALPHICLDLVRQGKFAFYPGDKTGHQSEFPTILDLICVSVAMIENANCNG